MVLIQIFEFLSENVDRRIFPIFVEQVLHLFNLVLLAINEPFERQTLLILLQQVDQERIAVVLFSPHAHQFEGGLRADAQIFGHQHTSHHHVVLPLLIRLDALVKVVAPRDRLVDYLLDAETLHLGFVHQDVVQD